jgi:hypothetical protein
MVTGVQIGTEGKQRKTRAPQGADETLGIRLAGRRVVAEDDPLPATCPRAPRTCAAAVDIAATTTAPKSDRQWARS